MEEGKPISPSILSVSWGKMIIEGMGTGRDFKLWPGGGRPWDWRETGTYHEPGILPGDVAELVENGSRILVFGCGMDGRLGLSQAVAGYLKKRHMAYHFLKTPEAVKHYNQMAKAGEAVGGLFHSTC